MKHLSAILCMLLVGYTILPAQQNPNWDFELSWKKEVPLFAIPLAVGIPGQFAFGGKNFIGYDSLEMKAFVTNPRLREFVNPFDRVAMDQYNPGIATATDYMKHFAMISPALLMFSKKGRQNVVPIAVMYAEAGLMNLGWQTFIKNAVRRDRPLLFNPKFDTPEYYGLKTGSGARTSFYSGHASTTATFSFLTAALYSDLFPDSKYKPLVWAAGALLPAATATGRVLSGYHYPTDVITGYAVGACTGLLIPYLHRKGQSHNMSFYPVGGKSMGMGMVKRF